MGSLECVVCKTERGVSINRKTYCAKGNFMAGKFYAVRKGKTPGIYFNWDDCKRMVDGYPGAIYKSFKTIEEAKAFMGETVSIQEGVGNKKGATQQTLDEQPRAGEEKLPEIYAFVDGSFNIATNVYGYGGFLQNGMDRIVLQGAGEEEDMASMRNVAGEVLGSMAAMEKAVELGVQELTIYYDYMGIEMWATGGWKRNKKGTIAYYEYVQSIKDKIKLHFVKVKGHSGVEGNEEADRLAKQAVGILE